MRVIKNRLIPIGKNYYAINLFGVVFSKGDCDLIIINHEAIHTAQMKELFYIGFYFAYIIEWLIKLMIHRNFNAAYSLISFEREAYKYERDLNYLRKRKKYNWTNFLSHDNK